MKPTALQHAGASSSREPRGASREPGSSSSIDPRQREIAVKLAQTKEKATAREAPEGEEARDGFRKRLRNVNLARLNHVFIPAKKPDRDRLRRGIAWTVFRPIFWLVSSLSREGRALTVVCLLVAAASVDVGESQVYLLFAMLSGLMVGSLAMRGFYPLRECRVEVDAPSRVSVGEALTFFVTVRNDSADDLWSLRVERPFLPWDGKWIDPAPSVARVEKGGKSIVRLRAQFIERGEHHLDSFEARKLVPLGLSTGRGVASGGCRFLVVPRIANVTNTSLIHRAAIRDGRSVPHVTAGDGEIAGVRPYRLGDPLKHLHVRTWARTGYPHVRHYVDERADRVALLVALDATDASEKRIEAAISLAAGVVARLASGDGSGIDHLILGERGARIEPRRGRSAVDLSLDALAKHVVGRARENTLAHIEPLLPTLSAAILVTADHSARRSELHQAIERAGVPCRWVEVVDDGESGLAPRTVEMGKIISLDPVPC